jgi:hypothetical protein
MTGDVTPDTLCDRKPDEKLKKPTMIIVFIGDYPVITQ